MASTSTACGACLRELQKTALRTQTARRSFLGHSARAYRPAPAAWQQTLYLDFLAPSTPKTQSGSLSIKRTTSFVPTSRFASRSLSTATATTPAPESESQPPPQALARVIQNPRNDDDGKPMLISISPRATNRLASIYAKDNNSNQALRVSIESGGCHGFQYLMNLEDLNEKPAAEDDTLFEGDKGAKVVIDEASLELLNGSTVDYTIELIGSQFKITGIPGATSSCGCGSSFDIKI